MIDIYYKVDQDTGELSEVVNPVIELEPGDRVRRKAQIDYYMTKQLRSADKTAFVLVLFTYGKELFPNISDANITRLMYAATFCNYDNSIMEKDKLKEKMKLNRMRWSEFWNEMLNNDVLYEKNDMVYINEYLFSKGKIDTDLNQTRLFCQYVQKLYEGCSSTSNHKQLSYLFKIIPFVNRQTNIVCFNPQEQDKSSIKIMKLGDFCDVVGYDRSNARRLVKELLKIRINGELALGFFVQDLKEETWSIIINPKLYFGGDRTRNIFKQQINLFLYEKDLQLFHQQALCLIKLMSWLIM